MSVSWKRPFGAPGTMDDERSRHPLASSENIRKTVKSPKDSRKNQVGKEEHMQKILNSTANTEAKEMAPYLQAPWFKHSGITCSLEFYTQL